LKSPITPCELLSELPEEFEDPNELERFKELEMSAEPKELVGIKENLFLFLTFAAKLDIPEEEEELLLLLEIV
jgi:hypothetical protein